MKVSLKTSQQDTTWDDLSAIWRLADDIDVYEGAWLFDHFYPLFTDLDKSCLEAWTLAGALASITKRLRIGHMVTSNTYRHPAVVANMVATLDRVSNGRFDFGFGAGWFEQEHTAYGIPLLPLKERFDAFDEALEVIDLLLTQPSPSFSGEHYTLQEAYCEPKPIQTPRPPFVIGGSGEKRLLRSAARWADHYNYPRSDPEDFAYRLSVLQEHCEAIGRDPGEIEVSFQVRVDDIGEAVATAARVGDVGADHAIFYLPAPADIGIVEPLATAASELR